MRLRRPLVLVVHDDPDVRVAQANVLSRAGYRCLVASDRAAGLWLAVKCALDMVPALYPGVVLVSPQLPAEHELPATVACVRASSRPEDLVAAVGHASWAGQARMTRVGRPSAMAARDFAGARSESQAGVAACS